MYCGNCGSKLEDYMDHCPNCGAPTGVMPRTMPVMEQKKTLRPRGYAIGALICAVLSALTCFFPFASLPLALLGFIFGIMGRRSEEKAMSTVALVISVIFLIWNAAVVVIAMIYMNKYGFDLNHIEYFVEQFFRNFIH